MADQEAGAEALSDTTFDGRTRSADAEITLGLLSAVQQNSALTQRTVARELGIALGLANAYLKQLDAIPGGSGVVLLPTEAGRSGRILSFQRFPAGDRLPARGS